MPRTTRTGRGITGEKHVRFDLLTEGEAFLRVQRTTKDELDDLEKWAKAELRKAGLPDEVGVYRRDGDRWVRLEKGGTRTSTEWRSLDRIVEEDFAGHETAYLAVRIIRDIPAVRSALASPDKHVAETAWRSFRLGQWHERARVSTVWGRDAVHGAKLEPVRRGLAKANKETQREAEARKERVRDDFERLRATKKPDGSRLTKGEKGEIVSQLAVTFDVSERTIRRDLQKK